jgi:hypothetical protein
VRFHLWFSPEPSRWSDLGPVAGAEEEAQKIAARANEKAKEKGGQKTSRWEVRPEGWEPAGFRLEPENPAPYKWPDGRKRWVPAQWVLPVKPKSRADRPVIRSTPAGPAVVPAGLAALNAALAKKRVG